MATDLDWIIPPNSPKWRELLKAGNERQLYDYTKRYYEYQQKDNTNRVTRELMPLVGTHKLIHGITENVRIYFNWFQHNECVDWYKEYLYKTREDFRLKGLNPEHANVLQAGKLHFLWSDESGDVVSCVNIMAVYGLTDRMVWETCHPEGRFLTVSEARNNTMAYFCDKEKYNDERL
jgi:hypothetical protein